MHVARPLAAAAVVSLVAVAGTAAGATSPTPPPSEASAAPEDQEAARSAIDAFTEVAVGSGFHADGPGQQGDILGLTTTNPDDPGASCLADVARLIDPVSGSFVGETARVTADEMVVDIESGADTDALDRADDDRLSATVVLGDGAAIDGFTLIADTMGSDVVERCLNDAMESSGLPVEFDLEPLDAADGGATMTVTGAGELFGSRTAIARVGDALVVVEHSFGPEPLAAVDVTDLLQTIVDALDG